MNFIRKTDVKAFVKNISSKKVGKDFYHQLNIEVKKMVKRACLNASRKYTTSHKIVRGEDLRWDWS